MTPSRTAMHFFIAIRIRVKGVNLFIKLGQMYSKYRRYTTGVVLPLNNIFKEWSLYNRRFRGSPQCGYPDPLRGKGGKPKDSASPWAYQGTAPPGGGGGGVLTYITLHTLLTYM
jgi:hypothetical protein